MLTKEQSAAVYEAARHVGITADQADRFLGTLALCDLALSALVPAASAGRQQVAECARIAAKIHYPEHWDTAAYPTVEDALLEIVGNFECSECHPAIASPEGEPDYKALHTELIMEVGRRFEGETRHETAKRYIRQTEERAALPGDAKATPSQN